MFQLRPAQLLTYLPKTSASSMVCLWDQLLAASVSRHLFSSGTHTQLSLTNHIKLLI